jgi:hypothetical protein
MSRRKVVGLSCAAVLLGALGISLALADYGTPRQYYGSWNKHASAGYYYRYYYYKPEPSYAGYRHHYAIYYPSQPKYVYFYNPYQKAYWGRCPTTFDGKEAYSMLSEGERKGKLEDIPETAFPKPGPMPKIPEATDNMKMELPPDDLPLGPMGVDSLPKSGK